MDPTKRIGMETWFRYADDLDLGPYFRDRRSARPGDHAGEPAAQSLEMRSAPTDSRKSAPLAMAAAATLQRNKTSSVPAQKMAAPQALIQAASGASLFEERIENDSLDLIREAIGGNCTRCKLHKARSKIVFGVGNPRAELVFVGEGPGRDEDAQGEPFVGRAGKLLTQMIEAMSLRREDVYICNVVKCRPPENRLPEKDEIEICSPFLLRQVDVIRPKVICALGSCAAQTLLQTTQGISRFRGEWFDFRGSKLMATYHPAYLLRNPGAKGEVWKDLQKVMAHLGLTPKRR